MSGAFSRTNGTKTHLCVLELLSLYTLLLLLPPPPLLLLQLLQLFVKCVVAYPGVDITSDHNPVVEETEYEAEKSFGG